MNPGNTRPEPIVDKNGVSTIRHKKLDTASSNSRSASAPAPTTSKINGVGYEEVRDVISDLSAKSNESRNNSLANPDVALSYHNTRIRVIPKEDIYVALIGENPTVGRNTDTQYGGKSRTAVFNERISTSSVNKVIDQMIEDGELVKVKENTYRDKSDKNNAYVTFPYRSKSGYVLAEELEEAKELVNELKNSQAVEKLTQEARMTVAAKHEDEVQAEVARLRAEAGI
jgi:polyhydroxyalkanoate synthesis regulator phasin